MWVFFFCFSSNIEESNFLRFLPNPLENSTQRIWVNLRDGWMANGSAAFRKVGPQVTKCLLSNFEFFVEKFQVPYSRLFLKIVWSFCAGNESNSSRNHKVWHWKTRLSRCFRAWYLCGLFPFCAGTERPNKFDEKFLFFIEKREHLIAGFKEDLLFGPFQGKAYSFVHFPRLWWERWCWGEKGVCGFWFPKEWRECLICLFWEVLFLNKHFPNFICFDKKRVKFANYWWNGCCGIGFR